MVVRNKQHAVNHKTSNYSHASFKIEILEIAPQGDTMKSDLQDSIWLRQTKREDKNQGQNEKSKTRLWNRR